MKRFSLRSARSRTRVLATGVVVCAMAGTMALSASGLAGAASAATPGVTSTTIDLGATEPLTGVAANYGDIAPAIAAVFVWANAHGGVNGRQIVFKYDDDQYTPSITSTMTHELVLQNNIFADVASLGNRGFPFLCNPTMPGCGMPAPRSLLCYLSPTLPSPTLNKLFQIFSPAQVVRFDSGTVHFPVAVQYFWIAVA